jgi:hypothetical protein
VSEMGVARGSGVVRASCNLVSSSSNRNAGGGASQLTEMTPGKDGGEGDKAAQKEVASAPFEMTRLNVYAALRGSNIVSTVHA